MNRRTALAATATALASLALSPMTALAGNGEQKQDGSGGNCDMTCLPNLSFTWYHYRQVSTYRRATARSSARYDRPQYD